MKTAGISEAIYCIDAGPDRIAKGAALANMVLGSYSLPDEIFASCNLVEIGALNAFLKQGISFPNDIAICGFDGIPATRITYPVLATDGQDLPAIAERLVANFIALVAGKPPDISPIKAKLVVRESTQKDAASRVRVRR